MKKLFLFSLLSIFLFHQAFAQKLDHKLGDILIQLAPETSIDQVSNKLKHFQGRHTAFELTRQISEPLNTWLINIDYTQIHERDFLAYVRKLPAVLNAQFNHLVSLRQTIPNDPNFASQWQWLNLGSSMTTADADVDAELAWDITTGGTTPQGDEIVIAVIDDGTELSHPDLQGNHWVNTGEIPGNGIDDDNNGYTDDYNGWNIDSQDDDVSGGDHGVEVAGMVGAEGNNMIGVCGINWNVKVMTIKFDADGSTEAEILEAYTYPLLMRRLYRQSGGTKGAFVVASNSSWGQDNGDPAQSPLWCAMYDTLGQAGILNCGATTNSNNNVDIAGDLPTTCKSDYLVAVASTDANDVLDGGYGPVNVDLAAPGIEVWTTSRNGNYRPVNGTSFATPVVTGIIGLMYAAPCSNLTQLAKEEPAAAALQIREYLLNSVDVVDPLSALVVTEGRANAFNALQSVLADCGACPTPLALTADSVLDISVSLNWFAGEESQQNTLRWRKIGDPNWTEVNNINAPYLLTGLTACTDYEWQIQSACMSEVSDFSAIATFQTEGCCVPPASHSISEITSTAALAEWPTVFAAQSYNFRIRVPGGSWDLFNTSSNSYPLDNLAPCTLYETQVQTVCDTGLTIFTDIIPFTTLGCGSCIDLSYCLSDNGNTQSEWIERVVFQNLDNTSGNNDGYLFVSSTNAILEAGASYPITLEPGYSGSAFTESFSVWIDYNQDGDFEDGGEQVFEAASVTSAVNGLVSIPIGALGGSTRMRVSMQFNNPPMPCTEIDFGEVEDYCIEITASTGCFAPTVEIRPATPTPAVEVLISNAPDIANIFDLRFRKTGGTNWTMIDGIPGDATSWIIDSSLDLCADYELQIRSICGSASSSWSSSFLFMTQGCGACLDFSYCESRGNSASFEFLQRVQLNTLDNESGSNNGYGDFTGTPMTTNLSAGSSYDLTLTPGYPFDPFDVIFSVWIDYNQDGDFEEAEEKVFESNDVTTEITQSIAIPASAPSGLTRMRIAMRERDPAEVCSVYPFGETEDYCIFIANSQDCLAPQLNISNVTTSSVRLSWMSMNNAASYEGDYRVTGSANWTAFNTTQTNFTISPLDSCEEYEARIRSVCTGESSAFSPSILFNTDCRVSTSSPDIGIDLLEIFPNPFTHALSIQLDLSRTTTLDVRLFSLDGRQLHQQAAQRLPVGKHTLQLEQLEDLSPGIYFLQLLTAQGRLTKKVVKY